MAFMVKALLALVVLITGALLAVTPWLMRQGECFAVTIPEQARNDIRFQTFKRRYAAAVLAVSAAGAFATLACGVLAEDDQQGSLLFSGVMCASVVVLACISFALMLHFRKKVQAIKVAEGWVAKASQAAAVVAEGDVPRAISLAWNLLYIPVILVTVGIGVAAWPYIPDQVPMHADFGGNVNGWAPKSVGAVFGFPVVFDLFMAVTFLFCHWTIVRSKRPVNPGAPATSALAYGLFARAQSVYLLAVGVSLCTMVGIGFMLSSVGVVTLGQMAAAIMVVSLGIVVGAIALSVVYGQAGSRLFRRMQQAENTASGELSLLTDDDEHWKLGVFYFNRDDASLFLPERFGIGWTINLGRPVAWAILAGFVVVVVGFVAAMTMLAG